MSDEDFSGPNSDFESVPGGAELLAWFGYVPTFGDAEIISLNLDRSGTSTLNVHTWHPRGEVDARGYGIRDKDVIVTFMLEDIQVLALEDFSIQNVISGLVLRKIVPTMPSFNMQWLESPKPLPDLFEITLEPCYGLAGRIQARRVSIKLTPGKPEDIVHND